MGTRGFASLHSLRSFRVGARRSRGMSALLFVGPTPISSRGSLQILSARRRTDGDERI